MNDVPHDGKLNRLYIDHPEELDIWHRLALCARIRDGVLCAYTEGNLHVCFWEKGYAVLVKDVSN